jgi:flagellin
MALTVNTNVAALDAYRNLSKTQGSLAGSLQKLSSGLRINKAADDAAGLAISQGLQGQIGGLTQAVRNAQDGINVVQTADGALTEVQSMLQRMNTLAVQYNSSVNNSASKSALESEFNQLNSEITRIEDHTKFNGVALFSTSAAVSLSFQVGYQNADVITVAVGSVSLGSGFYITSSDSVQSALTSISSVRADLGAYQNRLEHTVNNLNTEVQNLTASNSQIQDTDMAAEMTNFTRNQILSQAGTAMLAQAKSIPQGVLQLLQG